MAFVQVKVNTILLSSWNSCLEVTLPWWFQSRFTYYGQRNGHGQKDLGEWAKFLPCNPNLSNLNQSLKKSCPGHCNDCPRYTPFC